MMESIPTPQFTQFLEVRGRLNKKLKRNPLPKEIAQEMQITLQETNRIIDIASKVHIHNLEGPTKKQRHKLIDSKIQGKTPLEKIGKEILKIVEDTIIERYGQ